MGSRPLSRGQVQGGRWRVKTRRASLAGSTGQSDPGFAKSGETDPDPGSGDSAAPPPPRHVTSKGSLSLECGHLCSAPEELVGRRGSAGSADWRGGGGALEGPFQRVSWWSEGRRMLPIVLGHEVLESHEDEMGTQLRVCERSGGGREREEKRERGREGMGERGREREGK